MSKRDRTDRVKWIANTGSGDALQAAMRLEQVTRSLLELIRLGVDVAINHPVLGKRKAKIKALSCAHCLKAGNRDGKNLV